MTQIATINFIRFNSKREYHDALASIDTDLLTATTNGEITIEGDEDRVDAVLEDMLRSFEVTDVQRIAA
jgi:hypothetical protein